jgi:phosphoribosylformylglycinamidine cyclo-ligase
MSIDIHYAMDYSYCLMKKGLTYKASGVDIDAGERLVRLIKPMARSTKRAGVISGLGGFGALFKGSFKGLKEPVLVSATDGVGTKLIIAFAAKQHKTVGIDLVAMSVNDIITSGAEPLFFLDYFATGKLSTKEAAEVIHGIAKGCRDANTALIGGETAEMPGMYKKGEYDLAGFAVGVVDKKKIITGKGARAGDVLIGLASSGLHSNGFSLARKVFFDNLKLKHSSKVNGLRKTIGKELLTPTRIYVKPILKLIKKVNVVSIAHITGGGLTENLPRVLPKNLRAEINLKSWPELPIFRIIKERGGVSEKEMLRTFNSGIGMTVIVRKKDTARTLKILKAAGERAFVIGDIKRRKKAESPIAYIQERPS